MKVCTGLVWLMIRYGSEFFKHVTIREKNVHVFQNDTDGIKYELLYVLA